MSRLELVRLVLAGAVVGTVLVIGGVVSYSISVMSGVSE